MEIESEALENSLENNLQIETQNIISLNRFIFLSFISFGTYKIWWVYKSWKFFKQKDELDINPIARSLFSILFFNSLITEILDFAQEKNYGKSYSSSFLFFGFLLLQLSAKLPEPFWLISTLSFIFFIPPFRALNFAKLNSTEFTVVEQSKFNTRQIILIIVGIVFWGLVILGMNIENTQ
jgi:hypothetical protein